MVPCNIWKCWSCNLQCEQVWRESSRTIFGDVGFGTQLSFLFENVQLDWKVLKKYGVPKHIAYNVAYKETRYQGPFHWSYTPSHISSAAAVGPMQIITKWAHRFAGRRITQNELMTNIDLNVMVSMKMLQYGYKRYKNWSQALGAYNTGRPIINEYADYCVGNKNYKGNWIRYSR